MSSEPESVAIFWDYENCEIPGVSDSFSVTNGIRRIAHEYGNVKVFKAYSEASELISPRSIALRADLQACGVTTIDCPHNGRKDVADKMIMVDLLAHAIDFPPPSTVILISGDRDFSYAVSTMRLRKYRVVLLAPIAAHSSLRSQASVVYEWPRSVLQVEMPVPMPPPKLRTPAAYVTRPSAPIPIDRPTSSMVHVGASPSSPQSALFQQSIPLPTEITSLSSPQHHRSTSLPNPGNAFPTGSTNKLNYAAAAGSSRSSHGVSMRSSVTERGSPARQGSPMSSTQRLSPAWRSSKLLATASAFQPHSVSTPPTLPVVLDQAFDGHSSYDGDLSGDATDLPSVPFTPAVTEVSLDDEGRNSASFDVDDTNDQHDHLSAASSAPPTPLDDVSFLAQDTKITVTLEDGEQPLEENPEEELLWVQVRPDVVVPTVVMTRLRKPPQKFKLLVRVLERERLTGNTRVNFSQLGALLRQEHPAVYQRAGCAQLKDYVALAEDEGVVIVGKNFGEQQWDNGNKWAALHPQYHGKIPEPQPQQQQYPPPPPIQPNF